MSNYRNIVAIALAVLMVLSVYSLISGAAKKESQVNALILEAQQYHSEGLLGKAETAYAEAIKLGKSIELYNSVSDMYFENGDYDNSIIWAEEASSEYPARTDGYLRMIRGYAQKGSYKNAFRTIDEYDGRGLHDKEIEAYRESLKATFYMSIFSVKDVTEESNGFVGYYRDELWGLATADGSGVTENIYAKIGAMGDGAVSVCDTDGTWYLADTTGKLLKNLNVSIGGNIEDVGTYMNGLFPVKKNGSWSYYDAEMAERFGGFSDAGSFSENVASVQKGGKWYLINTNGETISDGYDVILRDTRGVSYSQGIAIAKNGSQIVLLNGEGKVKEKTSFEDAKLPVSGELFAFKKGGKWGFANLDGKVVIEAQYEDAHSFSNGFAAVCTNGLWGYIDEKNVMCIDAQFTACRDFNSYGVGFAICDGTWRTMVLYSKNF